MSEVNTTAESGQSVTGTALSVIHGTIAEFDRQQQAASAAIAAATN